MDPEGRGLMYECLASVGFGSPDFALGVEESPAHDELQLRFVHEGAAFVRKLVRPVLILLNEEEGGLTRDSLLTIADDAAFVVQVPSTQSDLHFRAAALASVLVEDLRHIRALTVRFAMLGAGYPRWEHASASVWAPRREGQHPGSSEHFIGRTNVLLCLRGRLLMPSGDAVEAAVVIPLQYPTAAAHSLVAVLSNEPEAFSVDVSTDALGRSAVLCRIKYEELTALFDDGCNIKHSGTASHSGVASSISATTGLAARLCSELNTRVAVSGRAAGIGIHCRSCMKALAGGGSTSSCQLAAAVELPSGQFDLTIHEFMCCEDPVGPMASGEVRSRPGRIALGADVALVAAADADLASLSACLPPVLSTVSSTETNAAVRLCDWSEESRKSNDDSCFVAELFCSSCNTEVGEVFFSTDNAPPANLPPSPAIDSVSVDVVCRPCDPPMAAMALSMNCADLRFKLHKIVFVTGDKNAIADEVGSAPSAHRNILRVDVEQEVTAALLQMCDAMGAHRVRLGRRETDPEETSCKHESQSIEVKVLSRDIRVASSTIPVPYQHQQLIENDVHGDHGSQLSDEGGSSEAWSMSMAVRLAFMTSSASSSASPHSASPALDLAPDVFDEIFALLTSRARLFPPLGPWASAFLRR